MSNLTGDARARYVRRMFGRIAPRYDLLNRLMTFGLDRSWRVELIRRLDLPTAPRVLDLGSGTGDLALKALKRRPSARVVAADFTPEMMRIGQRRAGAEHVQWVVADAARLPFAGATFDAAVSGFLLRNVPEVDRVLSEELRVLHPGGRGGSLDTTPPSRSWLRPLLSFHLHTVIPLLGRILAGDPEAYIYLPQSTERFVEAGALAARMAAAGFREVSYTRRMLGTIALHWGTRPAD
ncbi:MAG: ubiquinone/menaquinone biosynthesis methyltransferase [Chloroflexi bacterium]|nr:ubiquinone/menaquinone biosynthesis methyltransferase [Chloroflexota bacterium]